MKEHEQLGLTKVEYEDAKRIDLHYKRLESLDRQYKDAIRAALDIIQNEELDITEEKLNTWWWANLFEWIEVWGYKWIGEIGWSDNEELEEDRQRLERIKAKEKFKREGPS